MDEVNRALQRIARGTGIVIAGVVISMLLGFFTRVTIARYYSTDEYGVFNLALTILTVIFVISILGFQNSIPREVALYRKKDPSKIEILISTAFIISTLSAIIWSIVLIAFAGNIAKFLNDERLTNILVVISPSLPFFVLVELIVSISRGLGRVREQVYYQNFIYPVMFLFLILLGVIFKLGFAYIFFAYVISRVLLFLILSADVCRSKIFILKIHFDPQPGKRLIVFSLPLMCMGILSFVMNWTDTLMLGYYMNSEVVGIYNAAAPLARILPIFLGSAGFLYMPIASQLYVEKKIEELKRVYQILTKWIFLLTLPFFAVMFLFPETTIHFFFGAKYLESSYVLRILVLGFMFHTLLGLNGLSLIVIGKPNLNMMGSIFAASLNILFNAILIPIYGMVGAAIATTTSYFVGNVFASCWLYNITKVHPFSWNYVKPLVISFTLLILIKAINLNLPNIWYAIPILVIFFFVYFLLILFSKSIDREDVELLIAIERRLGIDLKLLKKILNRFV